VRTPAFKKWFGDWEKSPKKSSKVVDTNGEPLVVYHATDSKFTVFDTTEEGELGRKSHVWNAEYPEGYFFMTSNKKDTKYYGKIIMPLFVNMRYPVIKKVSQGESLVEPFDDFGLSFEGDAIVTDGVNYIIGTGDEFSVKLADGSNTTFDGSNPDIRYEDGGEVGTFKIDGKEATQEDFIKIYQHETYSDFFNLNPKKIEYNGNDIKIKKDVEDYNREISPYFKSGGLKSNYMKEIVLDAFSKFSFRKFGDAYRKNIDKYFTAENNAMGLRKGYTWKEKASYIVGDSYYHDENKFRGFAKDLGIIIPPNKS
jgi:hypothetical protein